ncbi:MAG: metallophosphoesterase family protein [Bdellovibrio sp.]
MKRTLIIGDVHGCADELEELIEQTKDMKIERIIFVGDLINKGPFSRRVLEIVERLNAISLLGNHELGFLKYLDSERSPRNPNFEQVILDLGPDLAKWRAYMKGLPTFYRGENFLVVHAGLIPHVKVEEIPPHIITRVRTWDGKGEDLNNDNDPPWYNFYSDDELVIYGHWAAQGLLVRENTIGLDSGCVWGGALSALLLPEKKIIQIKAKKEYRDKNLE